MAAGYAGIIDFTGIPVGAVPVAVTPGYAGIIDFTGLPVGIEVGSPAPSPAPSPAVLPVAGFVRRREPRLRDEPQVIVTRIGRMVVTEARDGFLAAGEAGESDAQLAAAARLRALRIIILTS